MRWDPELSIRLIERAGYGTTVEAAATARLVERAAAAARVCAELVGVLELALFADLPIAVEPSVQRLAQLAATDPDVVQLLDALPPLASALRYGDVRGTDADIAPPRRRRHRRADPRRAAARPPGRSTTTRPQR